MHCNVQKQSGTGKIRQFRPRDRAAAAHGEFRCGAARWSRTAQIPGLQPSVAEPGVAAAELTQGPLPGAQRQLCSTAKSVMPVEAQSEGLMQCEVLSISPLSREPPRLSSGQREPRKRSFSSPWCTSTSPAPPATAKEGSYYEHHPSGREEHGGRQSCMYSRASTRSRRCCCSKVMSGDLRSRRFSESREGRAFVSG